MEGFYRKKGGSRELLTKENIIWGHLFFGGREEEGFLSCRLPPLSMGDRESPWDRFFYWCLTREFQTGQLRLCCWERLKLQLGQVLNLVLVSWALAQMMPFGGLWFAL